ncbi:hypothetical protein Btru_035432 [Bulinus truncatus]|nr:hypothetical protein Btru_035432 [Bulinus truncatus]
MSKDILEAEYSEVGHEAEPYSRIEFNCERPDGTVTIHLAECGLETAISGLKSDMLNVFNIPQANQMWTLRGKPLVDNKTLSDYGISGTDNTTRDLVQIFVKSIN